LMVAASKAGGWAKAQVPSRKRAVRIPLRRRISELVGWIYGLSDGRDHRRPSDP
jgi:hypothetical protein